MKFEKNSCKPFHGSLTDFKYVPKVNMFVIMRKRRMDHVLWKCTDYIHSFFSIRIYFMKDVLYEVRCLKSNEDMILALTGRFKQLSHEPEKFR